MNGAVYVGKGRNRRASHVTTVDAAQPAASNTSVSATTTTGGPSVLETIKNAIANVFA
jgi:hypothetical protein